MNDKNHTEGPVLVRKFPTASRGRDAFWLTDTSPDQDGKFVGNAIATAASSNPDAEANATRLAECWNRCLALDDPTVVDADWVATLPGAELTNSKEMAVIGDAENGFQIHRYGKESQWIFMGRPVPTRGHVRRLCEAFGVPLKEGQ